MYKNIYLLSHIFALYFFILLADRQSLESGTTAPIGSWYQVNQSIGLSQYSSPIYVYIHLHLIFHIKLIHLQITRQNDIEIDTAHLVCRKYIAN